MDKSLAIYNTNTINRYGFRFAERALVDSLWKTCDIGIPSYVSHDMSRPIGWAFPLAIHFEPGLVRSVHIREIIETAEDTEEFRFRRDHFYAKMSKEKRQEIEKLRSLVGNQLLGNEQLMSNPATSFVEKDLAVRTFPEIFAKAHQDRHDLVPISDLSPIAPGVFKIEELLLFAHPYFRRSLLRLNSLNSDFLERLQNLDVIFNPRIALDRDMVGLASDYTGVIELMFWRGPKFNDDLTAIPLGVTEHRTTDDERFWFGTSRTEFWWKAQNKEHILEVEELVDREIGKLENAEKEDNKYGCRFVHSIVPHSTGIVRHLDGAIRVYTEEEMIERLDKSIDKAGKHTKYTKLWRIDGDIDIVTWKSLVTDYFRDNLLIGEYLGGIDKDSFEDSNSQPENAEADIKITERDYVPYSMDPGMGIRLSVTYKWVDRDIVPDPYTHEFATFDYIERGNEHHYVMDVEAIDLMKILERSGAVVTFDENIRLVAFEDGYVTFPLVLHNGRNLDGEVERTHTAIKKIVDAWNAKKRDLVIVYSIGFRLSDRLVLFSVFGHLQDMVSWLAHPLSHFPTSKNDIDAWVEEVAQYLDHEFQISDDTPPLFSTLMKSGLFSINRKPIEEEYKLEGDDDLLKIAVKVDDNKSYLREWMSEKLIVPAIGFIIEESSCTKCEVDYSSCPCLKCLDDGVAQHIDKAIALPPHWTDRGLLHSK